VPIPTHLRGRAGQYVGRSKLHLSWLPEDERIRESASELHVDYDRNEKYATITYTWEEDGNKEEGTLLVIGSESRNTVQMGWVDSWHQSADVLFAKGEGFESEAISATGTYPAPEGPDWSWRIGLEFPGDDELVLKMWNISPEGEEEWAVEARYKRA